MTEQVHRPVLVDEVVGLLVTKPGGVYIDGTVGGGGHTEAILKRLAELGGGGRVLGIDRDSEILDIARRNLEGSGAVFLHGCFDDLGAATGFLGVDQVDGILLDLGVSSLQFDRDERGFSFVKEAALDMRMDIHERTTAAEIVAKSSAHELERILREYGEERFAGRIARRIVEARRRETIQTTTELSEIICQAIPQRGHQRIHPATRTFQALRIAVNQELDRLKRFLTKAPLSVASGGRIAVISYHSLEDRLVKQSFLQGEREGSVRRITKKPLPPSDREIWDNPRARSAKLRVVEKI